MRVMSGVVVGVASLALWSVGCDDDTSMLSQDMANGQDLATAGGPDLTTGGDDLAMASEDLALGPDLATPPDLTPPPDMTIICPPPPDGGSTPTVYLAGVAAGAGHSLATTSFTEGAGWSPTVTNSAAAIADVAVTTVGDPARLLVVAHQTDDTLSATEANCDGTLPPVTQLFGGALTSRPPAVIGGAAADVIFRGQVNGDNHYYHTRLLGSWSQAVQQPFQSDQSPTVARAGSTLHSAFTGLNNVVFDGVASDVPTSALSSALPNATSNFAPAIVGLADGTLVVVFVGIDTIVFSSTKAPGGSFSAPASVCPPADCSKSDQAPVLTLDAAGNALLAYHGIDNNVYTQGLVGSTWQLPLRANAATDVIALAPAIAPGVGSAAAELVYVPSDGTARHTRLMAVAAIADLGPAMAWSAPQPIAGASLQGPAALTSLK